MSVEFGSEAAPPQGVEKFGPYTLLFKLGQGGMAEIFLALKSGMAGIKQIVVIKRIRSDQATNRDLIKMFVEEARIALTLSHPNICQIYDVGDVNGRHYLAMEYLSGEDVRACCRLLAKKRLPLPLEHSIAIVMQTAAGLHYAHTRTDLSSKPLKIVHRDVSPQNMFITFDGTVKLLDFGIAKAENRAGGMETVSGVIKGKLTYMSPEQVQGQALTPASDVYSLGIVLWELTTGKRLFKADTDYKVIKKIVDEPIPPPTSVWADYHPDLEPIVMKALARDVAQRYQTARELQLDLQAFTRKNDLVSGELELKPFMEEIFAERLQQERTARERGVELYEVLRDRDWSDSGISNTGSGGSGTGPNAPRTDTGPGSLKPVESSAEMDGPDAPELPEPTSVTGTGRGPAGTHETRASSPGGQRSKPAVAKPGPGAPDAGKGSSLVIVAVVGVAILAIAGVVGFFVLGGDPETPSDVRDVGDDGAGRGATRDKTGRSPARDEAKDVDADRGTFAKTAGASRDGDDRGTIGATSLPEAASAAPSAAPATAEPVSAAAPVTAKGKKVKKATAAPAGPATGKGVGSDLEDWGTKSK